MRANSMLILGEIFRNSGRKVVFIAAILGITASHLWGNHQSDQSNPPRTVSSLTGIVADSFDGIPLSGVNVTIKDLQAGAMTISDGTFTIDNLRPGTYTLVFSHLGYRSETVRIVVSADSPPLPLSVSLVQTFVLLEEVRIDGYANDSGPEAQVAGVTYMSAERIKTDPGAWEDVFRSLQNVPGVSAPNDFGSQFIVRGGRPEHNLIVLDDIEILNPYRLYGVMSVFNPELVSGVHLHTSGFPVRYGDRLASVLSVTSREGRDATPLSALVSANITNAGMTFEGGLPAALPGNWILSARRTYYDLIAKPIAAKSGLVDRNTAFPYFYDMHGKVTFRPVKDHTIMFTGFTGRDAMLINSGTSDPDEQDISVNDRTQHLMTGIGWQYYPDSHHLSKLTLSFNRVEGARDVQADVIDPYEDPNGSVFAPLGITSLYTFEKLSALYTGYYLTPKYEVSVGAGLDIQYIHLDWAADFVQSAEDFMQGQEYFKDFYIPKLRDAYQDTRNDRIHWFLEYTSHITEKLSLGTGLRFDFYSMLDNFFVSPRLHAKYSPDESGSMTLWIGRYLQSPGFEKTFGQSEFLDFTDSRLNRSLRPEESIHIGFGIDRRLSPRVSVKVETYYKTLSEMLIPLRVQTQRYTADQIGFDRNSGKRFWSDPYLINYDSLTVIPTNNGSGEGRGIELLLERRRIGTTDRWSGWISYSYSIFDMSDGTVRVPFDYDQRHNLSTAFSYKLSKVFDIGLKWKYATGFPYTPPTEVKPRIRMIEENGEVVPVVFSQRRQLEYGDAGNRNSGRMPDYFRFDIRLNMNTSIWGTPAQFYLDVINATNHRNVLTYHYTDLRHETYTRKEVTMLPILPTFGMSIAI